MNHYSHSVIKLLDENKMAIHVVLISQLPSNVRLLSRLNESAIVFRYILNLSTTNPLFSQERVPHKWLKQNRFSFYSKTERLREWKRMIIESCKCFPHAIGTPQSWYRRVYRTLNFTVHCLEVCHVSQTLRPSSDVALVIIITDLFVSSITFRAENT